MKEKKVAPNQERYLETEGKDLFHILLKKIKGFRTDDYRKRKNLEELFFSNASYEEFKKYPTAHLADIFKNDVGAAVRSSAVNLPNFGKMRASFYNSKSSIKVRRCW